MAFLIGQLYVSYLAKHQFNPFKVETAVNLPSSQSEANQFKSRGHVTHHALALFQLVCICYAVLWQKTSILRFIPLPPTPPISLLLALPSCIWKHPCSIPGLTQLLQCRISAALVFCNLLKESNLLLGLTLAYNARRLTFHRLFASFLCLPAIEPIVYLVALTGTYSSKVMNQASILYHLGCRVTSVSIVWGVFRLHVCLNSTAFMMLETIAQAL